LLVELHPELVNPHARRADQWQLLLTDFDLLEDALAKPAWQEAYRPVHNSAPHEPEA
jgi:hypothetical protein